MENQNVRLVITFVVGFLIGLGAYALFSHSGDNNKEVASESETATSSTQTIQGDNGVIVNNQAAGNMVHVEQVVLQRPGWVAIHDNVNGQPGRILGARVFDFGKSSGDVELLRNTVAGTSYFAVLHHDDGNYKNFNPKTDTILYNGADIVMVAFTADATSSSPAGSDTSVASSTPSDSNTTASTTVPAQSTPSPLQINL